MNKIEWKGGALLSPVPPVLVSCGNGTERDIITVAWTGIVNTVPPRTYISVRPERFSYHIIKETGEFVINLTTTELTKTADLCGMLTGKKVDKFKKCSLTAEPVPHLSCPMIAESPLSLECKVFQIIPLGSHDMFLADIVAVHVREDLIDKNGKLHLDIAQPIAYAHGDYYSLGKKLGHFGYSVKKKR